MVTPVLAQWLFKLPGQFRDWKCHRNAPELHEKRCGFHLLTRTHAGIELCDISCRGCEFFAGTDGTFYVIECDRASPEDVDE